MAIDNTYPVFAFYFRRYAPFKTFGRFNPLTVGFGTFDGDSRGPSVAVATTSRTYGCVFFNRFTTLYEFAGTSGTHFHPAIGDEIVGHAKVQHTLSQNKLFGPDLFGFRASTSAGNPLVPKSPDIDTYVDVTIDLGSQSRMKLNGTVYGDNFPSLEVFVLCCRSRHTALLVDARASDGPSTGPMLDLWGKNETSVIAKFSAELEMDDRGELATDYSTTERTLAIPFCRADPLPVTKS